MNCIFLYVKCKNESDDMFDEVDNLSTYTYVYVCMYVRMYIYKMDLFLMCANLQNSGSSSDDEFVASQHKKSSKATPAKQVHTHSTSMLSGIDQSAV